MKTSKISIVRACLVLLLVLLSLSTLPARNPLDDFRPPVDPVRDPVNEPIKAPAEVRLPVRFVRGDSDGNGKVEMSDAITTLSSLFLGTRQLGCQDAADSNDDGQLAISDAVHTLGFLFTGGVSMPAPFPDCGEDSTGDSLGCENGSSCVDVGSSAFQLTRVEDGYLIDLPEVMAKAFPDQLEVDLKLEAGQRGDALSGLVSRISPTTLHLVTAQRASLQGGMKATLRIAVAARSFSFPRALGFTCGPFACTCNGDEDCNDMFSGNSCGFGSVCIVDGAGGVYCICSRF